MLSGGSRFYLGNGSLSFGCTSFFAKGSPSFLKPRHSFKRPDGLDAAATTTYCLLSPLAVRLGEIGPLTPLVQRGTVKNICCISGQLQGGTEAQPGPMIFIIGPVSHISDPETLDLTS